MFEVDVRDGNLNFEGSPPYLHPPKTVIAAVARESSIMIYVL